MPFGYQCLEQRDPRSFLFYIVANVGPEGTSRPLAVAYRQGHDATRSRHCRRLLLVSDILRLVKVFAEPANRVPLEAERLLATAWYQNRRTVEPRPTLPDSLQPPYVGRREEWAPTFQPELSWNGAGGEFPFTSTCLLLSLLPCSNSTRRGDVRLQHLSTAFFGDSLEYGAAILDISDLSRIKYGITAFPVRYMADVQYHNSLGGWDAVEDPPPQKEPDIVPVEDRARVPLSILSYLRKYVSYTYKEPADLVLETHPVVDPGVLDYIWPQIEHQERIKPRGPLSEIRRYLWPSAQPAPKDTSTYTEQSMTPDDSVRRAIDRLLVLTQSDLRLDEATVRKFQKLTDFGEQLRRRLHQVPENLGPAEASGHLLRVAFAGCSHLNWVMFQNLTYDAIASAINSNELRDAAALSICVDHTSGNADALKVALTESASLEQVYIAQRPGTESDEAGLRLCAELLAASRDKRLQVLPTGAFSASLRRQTWPRGIIPPANAFPVAIMFVQDERGPNRLYNMSEALLSPERLAACFLSYVKCLSSDKSLLRFSCGPRSVDPDAIDQRAISPIITDVSNPRRLCKGAWALLLDAKDVATGRESRNSPPLIRYSFIKARQMIEDDTFKSDDPRASIEVVGNLMSFLAETAPTLNLASVEGRIMDLSEGIQMEVLDEDIAYSMFRMVWTGKK